MTNPVIGITTGRFKSESHFLMNGVSVNYVQAILKAGGTPVLIPVGLTAEDLSSLYPRLNGILLTGGGDVDPARFGGEPHPSVSFIDAERDELEIRLAQQAAQDGTPFLAICRGQQVVNVALGGTLYTDLDAQFPNAIRHDYGSTSPQFQAHNVYAESGTRLYEILGARSSYVNSRHHQAVKDLAPGLRATVTAPDGVVEGLELEGHAFGVCVQWHPEWMIEAKPMLGLFQVFVNAAALRMVS